MEKRFTRRTHNLHPKQKATYIISSDNKEDISKFTGAKCNDTYKGNAVDKLGQYEDLGSVEDFKRALELTKK